MIKLGIYQHYKTKNFYQVIGVARNESSHEPLVIYQSLYGDFGLCARVLSDFESKVDLDGKQVNRFEFIKENLVSLPELREVIRILI